ncbi:MAG: YhjD/YihY/BrkB family envelope integrity protein [Planctomycetota bacterium]
MMELARRVHRFLAHELWREVPTPSRVKGALLHVLRISILAGRDFMADRCAMRATALSYSTLLSIVPLLAFAFSVLKGMGVQQRLEPVLLRVAAGQEDLVKTMLDYVEKTDVGALGTIGLLFLIWIVIKTLGTVEKSFNEIWGAQQQRSVFRKFTDYVSVLVTAPLLLIVAMSLTGYLQSEVAEQSRLVRVAGHAVIRLLPFFGTWVAFSAVYVFMPNTSVKITSALVGGVIAGTVWQFAFWGYTKFQVGVARNNAIYGTFAALPIFMVWLYMSWTIVLFGAEVSWAVQNVGAWWEQLRAQRASFASREEIALLAMTSLSVAFHRDGEPQPVATIASRFKAPARLVRDVLNILVAAKLVAPVVADDDTAYQPARPLEHISPADVVAALRQDGDAVHVPDDGPDAAFVAEILEESETPRREVLGRATFRDIAAGIGRGEGEQEPERDEVPS